MKRPTLMVSSRRMCGVIGLLWLIALLLRQPFRLPDIARWFFLAGCLLGAALLVMLFVQHRREKKGRR